LGQGIGGAVGGARSKILGMNLHRSQIGLLIILLLRFFRFDHFHDPLAFHCGLGSR